MLAFSQTIYMHCEFHVLKNIKALEKMKEHLLQ